MKKKFMIFCILLLIGISFYFIFITLDNDYKSFKNLDEKYKDIVTETKSGIEIETDYVSIDDNSFYFKVPINFRELSEDEIKGKYSGSLPDIVFSNDDTTINVSVNLTNYKLKDTQISTYINYVTDNIDGEIISKDTYIVDKHTIGNIKFINNAEDASIYNNIAYFSYDEKLVIISFNLTTDLMEEWENIGEFIIDSLFFI